MTLRGPGFSGKVTPSGSMTSLVRWNFPENPEGVFPGQQSTLLKRGREGLEGSLLGRAGRPLHTAS